MPDVGENIKKLRGSMDWSQNRLAKEAKVSQPYLSELEDGKATNPSMQFLGKIAEALGITVVELLTDKGE